MNNTRLFPIHFLTKVKLIRHLISKLCGWMDLQVWTAMNYRALQKISFEEKWKMSLELKSTKNI